MEVVFVDWAPVVNKFDIQYGSQIRRYYAWTSINKIIGNVIPFRKYNGRLNWKAVFKLFKKNQNIWVEYGCGGVAHFFVLLAMIFRFNKKIILNVHDISLQQRDTYADQPFFKKMRMEFFERVLFYRADTIILPAPSILDYFTPRKNQKVIIMPPGIGMDELAMLPIQNIKKDRKIKTAIYFGSMRRKGIIPLVIDLFSELNDWNLILIGQSEGAKIEEKSNVKYLGVVNHNKLVSHLCNADVILLSFPKFEYFDKAMNIRLGYALKSCKPLIATKLSGICRYVSMLGLEENVIYLDEWNIENLKNALQKSQRIDINEVKTIESLRPMAWEPRFGKTVDIAFGISKGVHESIEWI